MDTTTPPTLFERLTGGRFMDIGLRWDLDEIEGLRRHPYRTCPCCKGAGAHIQIIDMGGMLGILNMRGCETCDNSGLVAYQSHN